MTLQDLNSYLVIREITIMIFQVLHAGQKVNSGTKCCILQCILIWPNCTIVISLWVHTEATCCVKALLQLAGNHLQWFLWQESGVGGVGAGTDCGQYDWRKCNGPSSSQSTFYISYKDLFNQVHVWTLTRYSGTPYSQFAVVWWKMV